LSTTLGSTVASISTFMECSSTPPTSTDTAGSQAGRSNAFQPVSTVSSDISISNDHVRGRRSNDQRSYLIRG